MELSLGQRWISNNETELGLGTLVAMDRRTVTVLFPSSGEQRLYTIDNAPITRMAFAEGDIITHVDEWKLKIESVLEQAGILCYQGKRCDTNEEAEIKETFLSHQIILNRAQDRMLAGQLDRNQHFVLRYQTLCHQLKQSSGRLLGLRGARVGLLPHQLNIAHEVGSRFAPRVLLADEVGLGKTIEAGLILHKQLVSGLAQRVLIVLPESLQHQWLLEMLRRFNLQFSLFDAERFEQERLDSPNPFESEQLVICSSEFLLENEAHQQAALSAHWDILVVDEAHHLLWDEEQPSEQYQLVEQLATRISGVLLLTATPEQLGRASHFARLRLLDPSRFHDYQQFIAEEDGYAEIAEISHALLEQRSLSAEQTKTLSKLLDDQDISEQLNAIQVDIDNAAPAREQLINALLDRHGTGRIFFRNTRAMVHGFPNRVPLPAPLKLSAQSDEDALESIDLYPEEYFRYENGDEWLDEDPRIEWLLDLLQQHKGEKFLLITKYKRTVMEMEHYLRLSKGVRTSLFHEDMSLIERDRAAAYFADDEQGAQILLCSEIGSEGRNFQFAKHLILLDLPLVADQLEQRIGRLDRIGQKHDVQIHIPYIKDTPQELLYHWYEEALDAFSQPCPTGSAVMQQYQNELDGLLEADEPDLAALSQLAKKANEYHQSLCQELEAGRDKLLELNSGGGHKAQQLAAEIGVLDDDPEHIAYSLNLFDTIGADTDELSDYTMLLRPSEKMHFSHLPGVHEDGTSFTFNRSTALEREDVQFMSWEHPILQGTMEQLSSSEFGSAAVAVLKNKALPAGTVLLEVIYVARVNAPKHYQLSRFLPATPIRLLLDAKGNNLADKVSVQQLNSQLKGVNRHIGSKLTGASGQTIRDLLDKARLLADKQKQELSKSATQAMQEQLSAELERMIALSKVNPNIRQQELDILKQQLSDSEHLLNNCELQLDALRYIVVSHD